MGSSKMLDTAEVYCPYCGEPITLLVDRSGGDQEYVEDCSVCCQPINIRLSCEPFDLVLRHQNET